MVYDNIILNDAQIVCSELSLGKATAAMKEIWIMDMKIPRVY